MARSTIDIVINSILQGTGITDASKAFDSIVKDGATANRTIGDMKTRLSQLNNELDDMVVGSSGFNAVSKEIRDINTDLKKAQRLASGLGDEFDKASNSIGILDITLGGLLANGITAAAGAIQSAAGAALDFGREAIQLGSDAAETQSLLTNALGPAFNQFAEDVERVSDATGQSAIQFQQSVAPILAMAKAQGFAAEAAGDLAVQFGSIALDLNSYFNSTTAVEDLQSALAGSSETLQKYGIIANETALKQEALTLGLISGNEALTAQERTTALLSLINRQAADALGDAERTANGFANTQRALNAEWQDFKTVVGESLVDAVGPLQAELLAMSRETLPELASNLENVIQKSGDTALGFIELAEIIGSSGFGQKYAEANNAFIEFQNNSDEAIDRFLEKLGITRIDLEAMGAAAREAQEEMDRYESIVSGATITQERFQKGVKGSEFFVPDSEPVSYYTDRLAVLTDVAINAAAVFEETAFSVDFLNQAFGGVTTPSIDTTSFITTVTNPLDIMTDVTASINEQVGDFNFNALEMNSSFEELGGSADQVSRRFSGVSSSLSSINKAASQFSSGNLIDITADADKDIADYIAEYASKLNLPVEQTVAILEAQGLSQEEINAKTQELLEKASALDIVQQLSAGTLGADGLAGAIESTQLSIENLESPIQTVKERADELSQTVNGLNGNFDLVLNASVPGLELIREAAELVNGLTGQEIPAPPDGLTGTSNDSVSSRGAKR